MSVRCAFVGIPGFWATGGSVHFRHQRIGSLYPSSPGPNAAESGTVDLVWAQVINTKLKELLHNAEGVARVSLLSGQVSTLTGGLEHCGETRPL